MRGTQATAGNGLDCDGGGSGIDEAAKNGTGSWWFRRRNR